MKQKKIAIIINHLSFFCSHILPIALEAKKKGYLIKIFCGYGGSKEMEIEAKKIISKNNLSYKNIGFTPSSKNIFFELIFFFKILKYLEKFNPDIIHGVSFKGIIYSSVYRIFFYKKKLICYVTGLGYFFTRKLNTYEKFLKFFVVLIVKFTISLKNTLLVVENKSDYLYFLKEVQIEKKKLTRINGAGADLKKFYYNEKLKKKIVLFPARVLLEKGIEEFINASKQLTLKYPKWKFLVAGTLKYNKGEKEKIYTNIKLIKKKHKNILFLGYVKNINSLFNAASIVCLPSYREGFPKALIEACASGCAVVATNVPGCKDAIKNNYNGLLCDVKNYSDTSRKVEKLILDEKKRKNFSRNSRKLAEKYYNLKLFVQKNLNFYESKKKR